MFRTSKKRFHRTRPARTKQLGVNVGLALLASVGCGHLGIDLTGENTRPLGGASPGGDEDEDKDSGGGKSGVDEQSMGGKSATGGSSGDGDGDGSGAESGVGGTDGGGGSSGSGGDQPGTGGDVSSGGDSTGAGGLVGSGGSGGTGTGGAPGTEWTPPCTTGDFRELEMITGLSVEGSKWGPSVSGDGLTLYFALSNSDGETIYRARRKDRGSDFGPAEKVSELDAPSTAEGTPFINFDESRIYFFIQEDDDQSTRDLFYADWDPQAESFGLVEHMPYVSGPGRDLLPWISQDQLTVYFTTSRDPEVWQTDIWTKTRSNTDEGFGTPAEVAELSSEHEETSPSLTSDGLTIYFTSDRPGPFKLNDDFDVWKASRDSIGTAFSAPTRDLDLSVNDAEDLNLNISPDDYEIFLSSDRSGAQELWVAPRACADFDPE